MLGSTFEQKIKVISKKYPIRPIILKEGLGGYTALKKKTVNFILSDNINVWQNKHLKIVHEFKNDEVSGYGIVFKKNSPLKKLINTYLYYIIRSVGFRNTMLNLYGDGYMNFYRSKFD